MPDMVNGQPKPFRRLTAMELAILALWHAVEMVESRGNRSPLPGPDRGADDTLFLDSTTDISPVLDWIQAEA